MDRKQLDKEVERWEEQSRAAIKKADAYFRWFEREAPIHEARTERVFRELSEAVRRR